LHPGRSTLLPPHLRQLRPSLLDRDERRRSYLDDEDNANVFCPDCAGREFDCGEDEDE